MRRWALLAGLLVGCGSDIEVPKVIYEKDINTQKFTDCMFEMLTMNTACRMQEDEAVFDMCLSHHHRYCLEQSEEMVRGGVE